MEDLEKAKIVLINYKEFYPKSLDPSLTPHVSIAPNHPSVDPYHVDDKILREMNAADYCDWVKWVINKTKPFESGLFYDILHNKYIVITRHVTDEQQEKKMNASARTFYRKLNHGLKLFVSIIPKKLLNHFVKMADKRNRVQSR